MRTTALFLLIGILFIFSLVSQVATMYTYWWVAIFRPQDWVWDGGLDSLRLSLIFSIIFLGHAIYNKKTPRINHPISILIVALLLAQAAANFSVGCADFFTVHTRTLVELFLLALIVFITVETIEQKKHLYWLITIMALSIGFHSGKGGIFALTTGADFYDRSPIGGMFSGSNTYALGTAMLVFFMIIALQCIKHIEINSKYKLIIASFQAIMLVIILGSIYNIMAIQSRGSFVALAGGLFIWMMLHEKRLKILTVFIISVSLALTFVPLPDDFKDRISSAFVEKEDLDQSAASRPYFWNIAFEMAKDHPLGVGPGCYPAFYNTYDTSHGYFGTYRSVHSSHFQILADSGFIGILIWLLIFIVSLSKLWAIRKESKINMSENNNYKFYFFVSNALICSTLVFLIGGSFYEFAYNDITWLIWGLVIVIDRLFKAEFGDRTNAKSTS